MAVGMVGQTEFVRLTFVHTAIGRIAQYQLEGRTISPIFAHILHALVKEEEVAVAVAAAVAAEVEVEVEVVETAAILTRNGFVIWTAVA